MGPPYGLYGYQLRLVLLSDTVSELNSSSKASVAYPAELAATGGVRPGLGVGSGVITGATPCDSRTATGGCMSVSDTPRVLKKLVTGMARVFAASMSGRGFSTGTGSGGKTSGLSCGCGGSRWRSQTSQPFHCNRPPTQTISLR